MIGDGFETPIMYQDLANYSMPYMNTYMNPYMNPYMGGSLIGGVRMAPQLDCDKVEIINRKEKEDKGTFKKAMTALGIMVAIGSIPILRKGIKKSGGVIKYIKSLFTPKPKKTSLFKKMKNWFSGKFKKTTTTPPSSGSSGSSGSPTP